jgi:hypothetical protein
MPEVSERASGIPQTHRLRLPVYLQYIHLVILMSCKFECVKILITITIYLVYDEDVKDFFKKRSRKTAKQQADFRKNRNFERVNSPVN